MRYSRSHLYKWIPAIGAVAVVLAAMLWLSGTFRSGRVEPGKIAVSTTMPAETKTATVAKVTASHDAEFIGTLQAERRATISARLIANITDIKVRAGDHVNKGDVLVELDDRDVKARVQQAREAQRAAQARLDLAQTELDRVKLVVEQNAASKNELDIRKAEYATASAELSRSQQLVSEAEVVQSDTRLKSPIDGIVIDRQAEPGDQASPGRTILTLYDPSELRLEAAVREAFISQVKAGMKLRVMIDSGKQVCDGTVRDIVPSADATSRSFIVKITLSSSTNLYPGMFGRVRLPLEPTERIEIPASSVQTIGQLAIVQVLIDGKTMNRSIRLGAKTGDRIEVLAGLSEGEIVLVK